MSTWTAPASAFAEEQPIPPPPQSVFRKPMLEFAPELYAAPSWEDCQSNSTKKRPPSTTTSAKKKRGTPARNASNWADWKIAPTTVAKPVQLQQEHPETAGPVDSDTSTDSAGTTFRFSSFPASLPRISLPGNDSTRDEPSFSVLMATPRAKLNFALGLSASSHPHHQGMCQPLFFRKYR